MEQVFSTYGMNLRKGKQSATHRRGGMDHGRKMRVVVVERRRSGAIEERIVSGEGLAQRPDFRLASRGEHAAGKIEDAAPRLGSHASWKGFPAGGRDEI